VVVAPAVGSQPAGRPGWRRHHRPDGRALATRLGAAPDAHGAPRNSAPAHTPILTATQGGADRLWSVALPHGSPAINPWRDSWTAKRHERGQVPSLSRRPRARRQRRTRRPAFRRDPTGCCQPTLRPQDGRALRPCSSHLLTQLYLFWYRLGGQGFRPCVDRFRYVPKAVGQRKSER
jgi:hypothetical protein